MNIITISQVFMIAVVVVVAIVLIRMSRKF